MINIQDIIPFMKNGWVAMDEIGVWCWYEYKPIKRTMTWDGLTCERLIMFDIAPADDWTQSLICIKGKGNE